MIEEPINMHFEKMLFWSLVQREMKFEGDRREIPLKMEWESNFWKEKSTVKLKLLRILFILISFIDIVFK